MGEPTECPSCGHGEMKFSYGYWYCDDCDREFASDDWDLIQNMQERIAQLEAEIDKLKGEV
jgi:ribosomal protein L37AE/L43A